MAREIYNEGEEIVRQDQNDAQARVEQEYNDDVLYRLFGQVDGFLADSFKVTFVNSTTVDIQDGRGFQYDNTQTGAEPKYRGIDLDQQISQAIVAADATHPRIDIICVKSSRVVVDTATRKFKATPTSGITNVVFNKSDKYSSTISYIQGTPGVSPVAPSVPSGYLKIAQIAVPAITGPVSQGDITDSRNILRVATKVGVDVNTLAALTLTTLGADTPIQTVIDELDIYTKTLSNSNSNFQTNIQDTVNPVHGAALVGYKSAVSGNWSPDPSYVKAAIDQLVARLVVAEAVSISFRTVNSADTLATLDGVVLMDTSGAGFNFTIPAASVSNKNRIYRLQKITADFNPVALIGAFSGYIYTNGETVELINNGTTWRILSRTGIHGVLVSTAIVRVTTGFDGGVDPTKGTVLYDKAAWYRNGSKLQCFYSFWQTGAGTHGTVAQPYNFDAVPNGSGLIVDIANIIPGWGNGDIELYQCGVAAADNNATWNKYHCIYTDNGFGAYGGGGLKGIQFMRDGATCLGAELGLDNAIIRYGAEWEIPITNW